MRHILSEPLTLKIKKAHNSHVYTMNIKEDKENGHVGTGNGFYI